MEEPLAGGANHGAVRVGRTVRRHAGEHTSSVQALLAHLERAGFTAAPRPLGIDEDGREMVTFLEGQTVGDQRPWPSWTHRDESLVAVGTWLRDFHDASRTFVPPDGATWFGGRGSPEPGEIVGHHDAAPYNAVWRSTPDDHGGLVGFIDWDLAAPAPPVVDLAFVALTWVPLTAPHVARADGFPADLDHPRRLGLLLDAYGWTGTRAEVLSSIRDRARAHATGLRRAAENGYAPAVAIVESGVADDYDLAASRLPTLFPELDAG